MEDHEDVGLGNERITPKDGFWAIIILTAAGVLAGALIHVVNNAPNVIQSLFP